MIAPTTFYLEQLISGERDLQPLDFAPFRGKEWRSLTTAPKDFIDKWRWDSMFHPCCGAGRYSGEPDRHVCVGPPLLLPGDADRSFATWVSLTPWLWLTWSVQWHPATNFAAQASNDQTPNGSCCAQAGTIWEAVWSAVSGSINGAWCAWRHERWKRGEDCSRS